MWKLLIYQYDLAFFVLICRIVIFYLGCVDFFFKQVSAHKLLFLPKSEVYQSVTKKKGIFYFYMQVDVNKSTMCLCSVRNNLYEFLGQLLYN